MTPAAQVGATGTIPALPRCRRLLQTPSKSPSFHCRGGDARCGLRRAICAWGNAQRKKRPAFTGRFCVGIALFSQAASRQVSSALRSLTSVFGMGTGGSYAPSTPTVFDGVYYTTSPPPCQPSLPFFDRSFPPPPVPPKMPPRY